MSDEDVEIVVRESNGNIVIETPAAKTGHVAPHGGSEEPARTYLKRDVAEQVHEQLGDTLAEGDA